MATKAKKTKKPMLIKCGNHFISPSDVRCITKVKNKLYIVKFFSDPNPDWPCWVEEKNIGILIEQFEIVVSDQ